MAFAHINIINIVGVAHFRACALNICVMAIAPALCNLKVAII